MTPTEHPALTRSECMSEEVQGNCRIGRTETENQDKNDDNEEVRANPSHDLPEWPQEFRHGLVDESVAEHRDASSSAHELPSEPRAKVGQHFFSLPEGPKLRHLPENQNNKGFLQKTCWYSRLDNSRLQNSQ